MRSILGVDPIHPVMDRVCYAQIFNSMLASIYVLLLHPGIFSLQTLVLRGSAASSSQASKQTGADGWAGIVAGI